MDTPTTALPDLLIAFLLATGMSFLLGLGLREYYLANMKRVVFGSTRTAVLIGLLGFVLSILPGNGHAYLAGLLILGFWLGLFYLYRLGMHQTGAIGLLIILMSYTVGPVSLSLPHWFLILYVITALFVLNAKERIRLLTLRMANEEVITLAKFLVLSGVILPLTPREPIATFLPVSLHQTWLAVVVISGISYLGYLVQTYFLRDRGILLTAAIGGMCSSTAATVVMAREMRFEATSSRRSAAAIVLATGVMYPRLLAIVGLLRPKLGLSLMGSLLALAALACLLALALAGTNRPPGMQGNVTRQHSQNPLELTVALAFAFSFLALTAATHFILSRYSHQGLHGMAFLAGFTDIDPFVLALLAGDFKATEEMIGKAILIAVASNNLLKAGYTVVLGAGAARWIAAVPLVALSVATVVLALSGQ